MRQILRANGTYILAISFGLFVLIGLASFLQTDKYRSQAYDIIGEVNEVQWRSTQAREKMVSIMGWARLAALTKSQEYRAKILSESTYLAINAKTLIALPYTEKIMPKVDIDLIKTLLDYINNELMPQLARADPDYNLIVARFEDFWPAIVLTTTGNLGNTQKRTADLEQKALYDNFLYAFVFATAIMVVLFAMVAYRSKALYNNQVRQFALLFSHMTFTRINGLSMWMHETLSPEENPDAKLLDMARKRITDLSVVTDWLARIAYPKFDQDNTPIVTLGTILDQITRPDGSTIPIVRADVKAMQLLVPQGQFHLMLHELLRNAKDAVEDELHPHIVIKVNIARRWPIGKDLIVAIEDSGVGMSREQIKKATTPFFSTKGESRGHSGLGLTGCARLIQTMGGSLAIQSSKGNGTTVTLACPLSNLPVIKWNHA
ncbi:sensor histidine kinase [Phyllobacterium calauticae]|uniref:sensor histidine kinase n=1 Tax=Phyllobacterium calauticae TaxID=2817027 RepID=UPI001CC1A147|nr:sensor histidine kinase [Phyllobacterium calauticae]MBZ3693279.1 sensor histidine kinase [Phyllobacterium calauticae]